MGLVHRMRLIEPVDPPGSARALDRHVATMPLHRARLFGQTQFHGWFALSESAKSAAITTRSTRESLREAHPLVPVLRAPGAHGTLPRVRPVTRTHDDWRTSWNVRRDRVG